MHPYSPHGKSNPARSSSLYPDRHRVIVELSPRKLFKSTLYIITQGYLCRM